MSASAKRSSSDALVVVKVVCPAAGESAAMEAIVRMYGVERATSCEAATITSPTCKLAISAEEGKVTAVAATAVGAVCSANEFVCKWAVVVPVAITVALSVEPVGAVVPLLEPLLPQPASWQAKRKGTEASAVVANGDGVFTTQQHTAAKPRR